MDRRTRRQFVSSAAGMACIGAMAGCLGSPAAGESTGNAARASFFVFGDVTSHVAGDAMSADVLVPVGQHGHGWEPGPRVREAIRNADVFVHGIPGFQPWADDIIKDLRADGEKIVTVDASAGIPLLEAGAGHGHGDDHEEHEEDSHDEEHGEGKDPHFWMDPLRVRDAVDNVRDGLTDADPDNADSYATNAENYRARLDNLHDRLAAAVETASADVILVAGHDSFQYFADRYGIRIEALTDVSPDDQPTPRDIERAQHAIEEHGLTYICTDPLESQQAAEQLVAETDAVGVLPFTAMPGLDAEWAEADWGYLEIMKHVNLQTIERALDAS